MALPQVIPNRFRCRQKPTQTLVETCNTSIRFRLAMNLLTLYTLCAGKQGQSQEGSPDMLLKWQSSTGSMCTWWGGSQEEATTSIGVQPHPT